MSITLSLLSPANGASRVTPDARVVVAMAAPGEVFAQTSVSINGRVVYSFTGSGVFSYPEASGSATVSATSQVINVKVRRKFISGEPVTVTVSASTNLTATVTSSYHFYVDESTGGVRDASLRRTRVDAPFPARVLELYRQAALGAVGSRSGSALVALIHRVKSSQLAAFLPPQPELALSAASSLLAREVEPINHLADAASQLDFMRKLAEEELQGLGVSPEIVTSLSRGFDAVYPQERAAALALTVLLAASKLPV